MKGWGGFQLPAMGLTWAEVIRCGLSRDTERPQLSAPAAADVLDQNKRSYRLGADKEESKVNIAGV